jgi:hypothetical protein
MNAIKLSVMLLSIAVVASLVGVKAQTGAKADPRLDPVTALAEGVRLLEAGNHRAFLLTLAPPEQVKKRAGSEEAMEEWVSFFAKSAEGLLAAMKDARSKTPQYDAARTSARFELSEGLMLKAIVMTKIDSLWYVGNK